MGKHLFILFVFISFIHTKSKAQDKSFEKELWKTFERMKWEEKNPICPKIKEILQRAGNAGVGVLTDADKSEILESYPSDVKIPNFTCKVLNKHIAGYNVEYIFAAYGTEKFTEKGKVKKYVDDLGKDLEFCLEQKFEKEKDNILVTKKEFVTTTYRAVFKANINLELKITWLYINSDPKFPKPYYLPVITIKKAE